MSGRADMTAAEFLALQAQGPGAVARYLAEQAQQQQAAHDTAVPAPHDTGAHSHAPQRSTDGREDDEQIALFQWQRLIMIPEPRLALLFHIPNGKGRTKAEAGLLKAMGTIPGVPDVCLPVASRGFHGSYLELKRRRGRTSAAQEGWLHALEAQGYCVGTYYGWVAAARHLCWYLDRMDLWREPQ